MLGPGDTAPAVSLPSTAGGEVSVEDARAAGPVVVVVDLGAWCSVPAEQLQTYGALADDRFRHVDVDVLPIPVGRFPSWWRCGAATASGSGSRPMSTSRSLGRTRAWRTILDSGRYRLRARSRSKPRATPVRAGRGEPPRPDRRELRRAFVRDGFERSYADD